jgi:hypothetical protein
MRIIWVYRGLALLLVGLPSVIVLSMPAVLGFGAGGRRPAGAVDGELKD